jgi:hypothetical protein
LRTAHADSDTGSSEAAIANPAGESNDGRARPPSAERHPARYGFERESDPGRAGNEHLERALRLHLLSPVVRVQAFYEFLEAERIKYAIRLPANRVLQDRIGYLLTRPVGRSEVRRFHTR